MKLFVGNLSFATVEDDLRDLFSQYGTVTDVFVATDRVSGRSRGFGFVELAEGEDIQRVIDGLNGQSLEGRRLTVNEARPQRADAPRTGDRGGRGRGNFERRRRF